MAQPLVSIVVPCFNAARYLEQALDSALVQSHARCEVVAVDDGSIDGTRSMLERYAARYPSALRVVFRAHGGVSAARNAGMDAARGTHLLFLDADDLLERDAIACLLAAILEHGADAAAGNWRNFWQGTDRSEVATARPYYPNDPYASCARGQWVNGMLLLRRTGARWTEERRIWEALEYMLNCLVRASSLAYIDSVVVNIRQHDSPERFSARYDHFEPAMTGDFFAVQKALLIREKALNFARAEALDQRIVDSACTLVRRGRRAEARELLAAVSWDQIEAYDWYATGTFAGLVNLLGPELGSALFYRVNRALGRL